MMRIYLTIVLLSLLITSACVPVVPAAAISDSNTSVATLHEMNIIATADGWDAPETVPAGWTKITLNNQSQGRRQAAFFRLDDDKTMDDVFAAIQAGMNEPLSWMTPYGGVSGVFPGNSTTASINLPVGEYIVIDPVPGADGVPGMARGYFAPLVVEESDIVTAPPSSDMTVELIDYAFVFDREVVTAGHHTIKVTNNGPQEPHEIVIIKLNEGATVQDFLATLAPDAPPGPRPGRPVAGTAPFATVTQNYLDVELESGQTYGLVCFLHATEHPGQRHFMLGMAGEFTVPN